MRGRRIKKPWKGVRKTKRAMVSEVRTEHVIDEKHKVYHTREIDVTKLPPEVREKILESPEEITDALRKVLAEKKPEKKEKKGPKHKFADIPFPPGRVRSGEKDVHTLYKQWNEYLNSQLKGVKSSIENAQRTLEAMEAELREKRYGKYAAKTLAKLFMFWAPSESRMLREHPIQTIREGAIATRWRIRRLRRELELIAKHREEWIKLYEREIKLLKEAYERYKENPTKENAENFARVLRKIIEMNAELREASKAEAFTRFGHWRFFKDGWVDKGYYKKIIARGKELRRNPELMKRMFAAAFATLEKMR